MLTSYADVVSQLKAGALVCIAEDHADSAGRKLVKKLLEQDSDSIGEFFIEYHNKIGAGSEGNSLNASADRLYFKGISDTARITRAVDSLGAFNDLGMALGNPSLKELWIQSLQQGVRVIAADIDMQRYGMDFSRRDESAAAYIGDNYLGRSARFGRLLLWGAAHFYSGVDMPGLQHRLAESWGDGRVRTVRVTPRGSPLAAKMRAGTATKHDLY
jgi:hypothetical protein